MQKTLLFRATSSTGLTSDYSTTVEVQPTVPVTDVVFSGGFVSFSTSAPAKTYYRFLPGGNWAQYSDPFTTTTTTEYYSVSDASASTEAVRQWEPPPAYPVGGRYQEPQQITLNLLGTLVYTTDGTDPRQYIPLTNGKATFDNGVLVLTS